MKYFDELLSHLKLTGGFNHTALAKTQTALTALESKIHELEARIATLEERAQPPVP